jgi:hypothetical protein
MNSSGRGMKSAQGNGAHPPPSLELNASNVFDDLEAIRRTSPTDLVNEKAVEVHIAIRKPKPREHFRVCDNPSMSVLLSVYVHKSESSMDEEIYFVLPAMEAYLQEQEELRTVQIVICRTLSGVLFLWPLPVHDGAGAARSHVTSARAVAKLALTEWTRMKWRRADNAYFAMQAEGKHPPPVWPDRPFNELLKVGFGDRIIDSPDHPVLKELRGIKSQTSQVGDASWLA